jgi:hypothetical protein
LRQANARTKRVPRIFDIIEGATHHHSEFLPAGERLQFPRRFYRKEVGQSIEKAIVGDTGWRNGLASRAIDAACGPGFVSEGRRGVERLLRTNGR